MNESIGPRIYLVGKILPELLKVQSVSIFQPVEGVEKLVAKAAVRLADQVLERMQWPDGKSE